MANKQVVVFEMADGEYGIDVTAVNGILRLKNFTIKKMPNVSPIIEGVINIRGNVNYIYNLTRLFELPEKPPDIENKIIMIYSGEQIVGYIVDEVTDIINIPEENIEHAPDFITRIQGEYIAGVGKFEDRLIIMLDTEKISK